MHAHYCLSAAVEWQSWMASIWMRSKAESEPFAKIVISCSKAMTQQSGGCQARSKARGLGPRSVEIREFKSRPPHHPHLCCIFLRVLKNSNYLSYAAHYSLKVNCRRRGRDSNPRGDDPNGCLVGCDFETVSVTAWIPRRGCDEPAKRAG